MSLVVPDTTKTITTSDEDVCDGLSDSHLPTKGDLEKKQSPLQKP
jgi:hypothetical protein